MRIATIGLVALLLTGCKTPTLSVHSEYFTRQDLASVIVDTPDPNKQAQIFGQRLYISWSLPKKGTPVQKPLELFCEVRLKKGKTLSKHIPIQETSGTYIFPIIGKNYTKQGGLLSYKVSLIANGKVIAVDRHKFWVDPITFPDTP